MTPILETNELFPEGFLIHRDDFGRIVLFGFPKIAYGLNLEDVFNLRNTLDDFLKGELARFLLSQNVSKEKLDKT